MRNEKGYTLIEMLAVLVLGAILLTLAAGALRNFWFVQSLESATSEVTTQLRRLQTRSTSESHPLVYGARFRLGASEWGVVRYDPNGGTCTEVETKSLDTGVFSAGAKISSDTNLTSFSTTNETMTCRSSLNAPNDHFAFFYSRGSATAGQVTVDQPQLGRTRTVTVAAITGRVTRP